MNCEPSSPVSIMTLIGNVKCESHATIVGGKFNWIKLLDGEYHGFSLPSQNCLSSREPRFFAYRQQQYNDDENDDYRYSRKNYKDNAFITKYNCNKDKNDSNNNTKTAQHKAIAILQENIGLPRSKGQQKLFMTNSL